MRKFSMYYLYLKSHNVTGLKYLGVTKREPFKYRGSGKYWKRHIEKYGYDVTTEILFKTDDKHELKEKGLLYSNLWNIVESKEFANLRPEDGNTQDFSAERIEKITTAVKKKRKPQTEEHRRNVILSRLGKKRGPYKSTFFENSPRLTNPRKWFNDGVKNIFVPLNEKPDGFVAGRLNFKRGKNKNK